MNVGFAEFSQENIDVILDLLEILYFIDRGQGDSSPNLYLCANSLRRVVHYKYFYVYQYVIG